MKTVQEYLHIVDIDKLVNKYMWNYPPDTMEFMKKEFRRIAIDAQIKYSRYSKKKELATLLSLLED